ncbi:PEF-CTERM sorting domain-containing protein [Methanolobus bombayensis]|uniref:PEF-CTERM sorting domain-containing protein n=1 Tax=Methanolobus bombayensis TaxID=38023 RepID=UPI001FD76468|nr:PEF-CTERM sorting domain-containing protein [Methanolobus bombayensis]MBP1907986.1 hypothetical protein [Methanolobus bombayensis]
MKKILIIAMILAIAIVPLTTAAPEWQDCEDAGCTGAEYTKFEPWPVADGTTQAGVTITNTTTTSFDWESERPVCGIFVKSGAAGDNIYTYGCPGEYNGYGVLETGQDISHVTFCFCDDPGDEIPEFPTIALPIAAIIGLAFIMQRRKE